MERDESLAECRGESGQNGQSPQGKTRLKKPFDRRKIFYYSLMALPLLQFCIFYIGVNLQSIFLAFQTYENSSFHFASDLLVNFKKVIQYCTEYNTISVAARNSVILWFFTSVCGTALAIFFSYYIFKRKRVGRFFRFVLFLPSILPAILLATMFKLFTADVLPVALGWEKLLETTNQSLKMTAVIGYTIWIGFGTQVLLYSNAMEQISPSVIEAAEIDGAKPLTEFIKIILPDVMPTVTTFLLAAIAGAFINQANLYSFYGESASSDVFTLGYYMFILVQNNSKLGYGRSYYPFASAIGLCCTVIAIPLTILFRKFSKRFEE